MNTIEKIKKELEDFNKKKIVFVEELRKEFPAMFKELFDRTDKIDSVSWTQYTPYFNDGDTCRFGVHEIYWINGEDIDENEHYDWRLEYYLKGDAKYQNLLAENPDLDVESYKVITEIQQILYSIPNDFMEELFGDHVKVTLYRNGTVETEDYDHD